MKVSIVECNSYDQELVDSAIEKSLKNINFDIKEKSKVLIKPNILGQNRPEQCITTHPAIAKGILRILKDKRCDVTLVESSGFYQDGGTLKAFKVSGLEDAAKQYGAKIVNLESVPIIRIDDKNARYYKNLELPKIIFEADLIINLPKLKTHTLMRYTGAVKNLFGMIPGGRKQKLHAFAKNETDFGELLVDIYQNVKPQLNIMDAVMGLEGNGPGAAGKPKHTGLIIASENSAELDIVASEIIGFDPMEIKTNKFAIQRGLASQEKIKIIGIKPKIKYKKPINAAKFASPIVAIFMSHANMSPYVLKKQCKKCGRCKKVCPMDAITLNPYPSIDYKKCISCYCCHENCPFDAMELKGSLIFDIGRKIKNLIVR